MLEQDPQFTRGMLDVGLSFNSSLIKCLNVFVFGRSIIEPKAPHQLLTNIMSDTQVENALVQVAH